MERPVEEIKGIIETLTMPRTADEQRNCLIKYFTSDAGFEHPLCRVRRGPGSREAIVGIYNWYHVLSPTTKFKFDSATLSETRNADGEYIMYVEGSQLFSLQFVPLHLANCKIGACARVAHLTLSVVKLQLKQTHGKYHITQQTDYYQPEDVLSFGPLPFIRPVVLGFKHAATLACNVGARVTNLVGIWAPYKARHTLKI